MTEHWQLRDLMGGYVLGGLSPEDRRAFEIHLMTCDACRDEVLLHASLPGLLRRQAAMPAPPPTPGPDTLPRLLEAVARDRTRRRRRTLVGALVAAAVVVVALVAAVRGHGGSVTPPPAPAAVVQLAPSGGSSAAGEGLLIAKLWGTEIELSANALPGTGPFRLVVISAEGTSQLAATWGPTPGGAAHVTGATSLKPSDIAEVRVLGPSGAVLSGVAAG